MTIPHRGRRRSAALGLALVAATMLAAGTTPAAAAPATGEIRSADSADAVPGSYIVVFRDAAVAPGAVAARARSLAAAHGGSVARVYTSALRGFEVRLPEAAAGRLAADPSVAYVEQNQRVSLAAGTQTSPPSWGLNRVDEPSLPLDGYYTYPNRGGGVHAYVIDSGIRFSHSDFGGRATTGYDFVDGGTADDCNGHGTHVAGTIGGSSYGVAKSVSLVSVRVFDCTGGADWATVIAAVDWVTANAVKPAVVNMSLGGGYYSAMNDAVTNSIASGITYAVAAMNDSTDACTGSPASTPGAITVGATTSSDARASYSNYGSCLDLFAPGDAIVSAGISSDTSSATKSGTSMATPHVAGAAALILAENPTFTPTQVRNRIVAGATTGKVTSAGTGSPNLLLRVDGALRNPYTPIEACGSGYQVIDAAPLAATDGSLKGRVYLLYNSGNGYNCTTTMKATSLGTATSVSAYLEVQGRTRITDSGSFSYYAGPVRAGAAGLCVKWGGSTAGISYGSPFEHCG